MDDANAVRRCQDGDSDAFRLIVDRYGDVLYGTAFLMTGDRALAEDMVQEAFVLAWRGIRGFRGGTNLKAWLMKILVNRVISELRQRRRHEPLGDEHDLPGEEADAVDVLVTAEEQARIRGALSTLALQSRQIVVLRFYAQMTVPEIANALGCREGTVKSRLHRALRKLRNCLEPARPAMPAMALEIKQ